VISHGKVVLMRSYGLADVEQHVPVTEHTVFEIASVSKQFTATAIMMLVQDGRLSVNDTITRVLDSLPETWKAVTIRHLLTHTSGIPELSRPEFHMNLRKDYQRRELVQLVANAPLDFMPGARHSYSNTGYALLGMVIEKVSGKEYGSFLRERLFEPLGMHDTRFNDRRAIIPHRARGYELVDYALVNAQYTSPSLPFAAGGLVSSVADMVRWMQAQGSEKLLPRAAWEQMWSKTTLSDGTTADYGFGWNVRNNWSRKRIEHGGGIEGFSAADTRFIDDSLDLIFLSNLSDGDRGHIVWGLMGIYLPATRYVPPAPIADRDTATTRFLRTVVNALVHGVGDSSWYTPRVQRYYFPDRIKARKAIGALGPLESFGLTGVLDDAGRQKRVYRAFLGPHPVHFTLWVTPDRRIDGVDFEVE
jgi:D-alanyl-D-alanine carboxypeptidase